MSKIVKMENYRFKECLVDSDKVLFVFTAMGTWIGLYVMFVKLMNKKGYSIVIYDYPLRLLFKPDMELWEKFNLEVVADVQGRISEYKKQGVTSFYAYGVSMGTLLANRVTRSMPAITHVILNLTYGDVADNIWSYRRVRKTKKGLLKQGIDREKLRQLLKNTNPIVNAEQLKGKKVLLYLSKIDQVLLYKQTKFTKKAFEDADLDFEYVENRYLGHYMGATKNMLAIKKIDKFYKTEI